MNVKEKKSISPLVIIGAIVVVTAALGGLIFKYTQSPAGAVQQIVVPEDMKYQRGTSTPTANSPRLGSQALPGATGQ